MTIDELIAKVRDHLAGIDQTQEAGGYWQTEDGARAGKIILRDLEATLRKNWPQLNAAQPQALADGEVTEALRDAHLPDPAVCDWLFSLKWSSVIPETRIEYPLNGHKEIKRTVQFNFRVARAALGADEMIDLAMPVETYIALQNDCFTRM